MKKTKLEMVKELRSVGFNSLEISNELGLSLRVTNKLFTQFVPDPESQREWVRYTRYDDPKQKEAAMAKCK
jgi:hypothetical protein